MALNQLTFIDSDETEPNCFIGKMLPNGWEVKGVFEYGIVGVILALDNTQVAGCPQWAVWDFYGNDLENTSDRYYFIYRDNAEKCFKKHIVKILEIKE